MPTTAPARPLPQAGAARNRAHALCMIDCSATTELKKQRIVDAALARLITPAEAADWIAALGLAAA